MGENPNGEWSLRVSDKYSEKDGVLISWSIKVYGHAAGCGQTISGDQTLNGRWDLTKCESVANPGKPSRYYGFTLDDSSEVMITLESADADTYLYLREGDARSGDFLHENDDIESVDNTNSRIVARLGAGSYTIEATTYAGGATGSFTLTVSGLGPGEPPHILIGTASVDGTPVPPGTSITAWDGDRQIGSAKAREDGKYTLFVARSAGPITFKIGSLDADQTYRSWMSGQITRGFDLTATATCRQALSGDGVITGEWADDCESENRTGSYARYYSFTVEEESEVTITLESEIDTWVYLLEGSGRSGAVQHDNDDIESGDTDSQIVATLSGGSYTIEATTYRGEETGSFTLTVSGIDATDTTEPEPEPADPCGETITGDGTVSEEWAAGCESAVAERGYARYYSFMLGEESEVTIDLESSEDPYLYLREGESRSGAFLQENDDIERGVNTNSRIVATLAAGTYTIEATTYNVNEAGSFTLTVSGLGATATTEPSDACGETITSDGTVSGEWAAGCESAVAERGYARYYGFSLVEESDVTVTLESSEDTYLYLRSGEARSGTVLHENDDVEVWVDLDSRISETLTAGTYTIEATTFDSGAAGTFTLTVSVLGAGSM